jgi:hypothetical protein
MGYFRHSGYEPPMTGTRCSTIPVVMTAIGEAVQTGVVASIARPGGNITGLSSFVLDVSSKRLELMSEMVRSLRRIGHLSELNNPMSQLEWNNVQKAAQSLRVETHPLDVRRTEDFGRAFNLAVETHDPNRLYLCGHSSGAHLAVNLAMPDYLTGGLLTRDSIIGCACISGCFDLEPVLLKRTQRIRQA